tara:strand:+ start:49653 stop:50348 length:696 start_codon:yes stop_codon:yes gene_type:complete
MRTQQQIDKIKQGQGDPFSITNIPIDGLLDYYFANQHDVLQKSTGPRVLKVNPMDYIFYPLLSKLQSTIDPCKIRYMHYFDVTDPHILHNDDEFEYPNCYKAFTIPLKIYGNSDDVKLVIFDQYYYGGPAKFVNGEDTSDWNIHYNTFLSTYNNVENIKLHSTIDSNFKDTYLTHLRENWLNGLSINKALPWRVGDALCFDSLALHCSSDFKSKGIERKIGISIFTVGVDE